MQIPVTPTHLGSLMTSTASSGAQRRTRRDLTGFACSRIKDLSLRCEVRPGQKLTQEDLARRLGVSLTPVRAAREVLRVEKAIK
jgi:DNA-binding GntR family transcriptional regulator